MDEFTADLDVALILSSLLTCDPELLVYLVLNLDIVCFYD